MIGFTMAGAHTPRPEMTMHRSALIAVPTRFAAKFAAVLILVVAPPALGQNPFEQREPQAPLEHPVEVAASIKADGQWTYHFGLNQTITTQPRTEDRRDAGPLVTTRLIQNATIELRVVSIDPESGMATIEARFERLLVVTGANDLQSEFRWSAGSPAKEPATALDRLLTTLAGSTLTARVSPKGSVRGVVGYEAVNEAIDADPEVDRSALGLFAPSAIGSTLELLWKPGEVSGASRNVADAWSSARRASLGQIGGVEVEQALRVDRIEEGVLKAQGEASLRLLSPAEAPSPGAPAIELVGSGGRMKITWDLARGCSVSASERLDLGALWSLGPARLGVTMRSERSVALESPPVGTMRPGEG